MFAATEIPAHINVNTASQAVLSTLPGLKAGDIQAIVGGQPQYGSADTPADIYQTPAWLYTQAKISSSTLSKLEPLITARTQVYRVQSVGFADPNTGTVSRVEAVIDMNYSSVNGVLTGQPRILSSRVMDDFGRFRPPQP